MSLDAFLNTSHNLDDKLTKLYAEDLRKCNLCTYSDIEINKKKRLQGKLGNKKIFIVSQNPSCYWYERDPNSVYVFGGLDGFDKRFHGLLTTYLKQFNLSFDDFYITNVVKCCTQKNECPAWRNTQKCVKRFFSPELALVRPEKIIVLGALARRVFNEFDFGKIYKGISYFQHPSSLRFKSDALDFVKEFTGAILNE